MAIAQNNKNIPHKITDAFQAKYPEAKDAKWKTGKTEYSSQFTVDKIKYNAFYSMEGNWLRTESKISLSTKLPEIVQDSLHKTKYTDWNMTAIKQIDDSSGRYYQLEVNDSNKLSSENHHALTDHFLLWFDEKGHLVKTQKKRQ